jgi:hypothetical protein
MEAIKIILAIAAGAVIGFYVGRWTVVIELPEEITPQKNQSASDGGSRGSDSSQSAATDNNNSASTTAGKSQAGISESIETEFWKLVESGNINKKSYDSLTVKYPHINPKNEYKVFCYLYMSKSYDINCNDKEKADGMRGFEDGFARIPEIHRKSIKDLNLLQSFIRGDTINVLEKYIKKIQ